MLYFALAKVLLFKEALDSHVPYAGPIIFATAFTIICYVCSRWANDAIRGRDASVVTKRFVSLEECCTWLCKRNGTAWNPPAEWNQLPSTLRSLSHPSKCVPTRSEGSVKERMQGASPGTALVCYAHRSACSRWLCFFSRGTPTLFFVPDWQPVDESTIVQVIQLGTMRERGSRKWASRETIFSFLLWRMRIVAMGFAIAFACEEAFEDVVKQGVGEEEDEGGTEGEEEGEDGGGLGMQTIITVKFCLALALTLILGLVHTLPDHAGAESDEQQHDEDAQGVAAPDLAQALVINDAGAGQPLGASL